MKQAIQLAFKNIMGAGLRTWLNVLVLAFAFVVIIFYNAFLEGWNQQAETDGIEWEYGYGQLQHADYDPYDPFTFLDGHGVLANEKQKGLTPLLIRQASIYPDGRMVSVLLKGIPADQSILNLPTDALKKSDADIPAIIGKRMAASANLKVGDLVLLRWRDENGTFDASNVTVAGIFDTTVPNVDNGQIWVDIEKLWQMTGLKNHASLFVASEDFTFSQEPSDWKFLNQDVLLGDIRAMVQMEKISSYVIYGILLFIALLAIFDTQVLSVFRRQKEIGTLISLGMTRAKVAGIFTFEGSIYSILAVLVGGILGLGLFIPTAINGISMPKGIDDMGFAMADTIYPAYSPELILGTVLLLVVSATFVSFLPARKIAKMNPVDALKGKLQ
jgi:ABC-type lipoprotein release transport system permease subunit